MPIHIIYETIQHTNNRLEWRRTVLRELVSVEKVANILIYNR